MHPPSAAVLRRSQCTEIRACCGGLFDCSYQDGPCKSAGTDKRPAPRVRHSTGHRAERAARTIDGGEPARHCALPLFRRAAALVARVKHGVQSDRAPGLQCATRVRVGQSVLSLAIRPGRRPWCIDSGSHHRRLVGPASGDVLLASDLISHSRMPPTLLARCPHSHAAHTRTLPTLARRLHSHAAYTRTLPHTSVLWSSH
jgi:hypothetical protein